jgi:Cd2+/Zn2+-exporting ATPase
LTGFLRFMASDRHTGLVLLSAGLLTLSLSLAFSSWPFASIILTGIHLTVILTVGFPIARKGIRSLIYARRVTIDLLMSIAAVGALLIGETGEAALVIVLFAIGEALEGYSAERARGSLKELLTLAPDEATVIRACMDCAEHLGQGGYTGGPCPFCGEHETRVPVRELQTGERAVIRPGERLPIDGTILRGASWINQAPITGESIAVFRSEGEMVFAGTINGEGALEVRMDRPAADSTIARIARMVEDALSKRSPAERFVDRFAAWYTPAVVALATLIAIVPPLVFGAPFLDTADGTRGWLYRALALLIVACPCALVISTPVTVVSALTTLARNGILVKGGAFLEALARVKVIAFDKTGTLTLGQPRVTACRSLACLPDLARCAACDDMLALAGAVESRSEHPLARAIITEMEDRGLQGRYAPAESVMALAGQGVSGQLDGSRVLVGSHTLFHERFGEEEHLHQEITAAESGGHTVMLVGRDADVLGYITVADEPRLSSQEALIRLHESVPGLRTVMLTGDHPRVAEAVAARIGGIDQVMAGLLPGDKLQVIESLRDQDGGEVAMVGDGINDAPALAAASVGVAMGGAGTAQAMEIADIVLMADDLSMLPYAVNTSQRASRIIRQNIAFSLAIKALFLVLTLLGGATLWMAVFADMGASLLVTFNGMRMLRDRG